MFWFIGGASGGGLLAAAAWVSGVHPAVGWTAFVDLFIGGEWVSGDSRWLWWLFGRAVVPSSLLFFPFSLRGPWWTTGGVHGGPLEGSMVDHWDGYGE